MASRIGSSLWTPEGEVSLQERSVVPIPQGEIILFSKFHEMGQKYGFTVVCKSCDKSVTGANSNLAPGAAVACGCREFRYITG